jgi:hypothetical protein
MANCDLKMKRKTINKHLRVQVLTRNGYKCRICGRSRDEVALEVDHIVAVSSGGSDEFDNLAALCRDCNSGKSDYSFSNYTSMTLIPDGLEQHFRFFHDPRTGDFDRYHLYCYFKQPGGSLTSKDEFYWTWKITDTERAVSSDPAALEERRKAEEMRVFKENIRCELAKERKRLIINEEGLVKV